MFTRAVQGDALKAEGHVVEAPFERTWFYSFKDRYRPTEGRPVVDVSVPFNAMDETHRVRKFGVIKGFLTFESLNHFVGAYEQIPYSDSHHTFELGCLFTLMITVVWANIFIGRTTTGNTVLHHPRLFFATNLVWWLGLLRTTIGASIASFGYFYSYELLYTHVPGFKIRDPSNAGWRRPYEDGQSTYGARLVASVFPALGAIFCSRRLKRSGGVYMVVAAASLQYEYARSWVMPGSRVFYNVQAEKYLNREANWGSLSGDLRRKNDQDTGKNLSVSQFRYMRMTTGALQDIIWENATHDNRPGSRQSYRTDNPYYNWQKAPQTYNANPIKHKNQLWAMPSVLNARNISGAMDA